MMTGGRTGGSRAPSKGGGGSSVSTANMLQIIMLTAAIMLVVSTYGFFQLPNDGSKGGPLESEFQELRAMMQKQGEAFSELQQKMSELSEEEHKIREELFAVMEDQRHDNQAKPQQPQTLNSINAERRSARERMIPRKVDGGMHRWNNRPQVQPNAQQPAGKFLVTNDDDAPDLSMYVKRMSLTDDKGCSSGQRWNGASCEWMTKLERRPTVTPQELEEYFRIGRAVILTNFTDEWKAFENWTPEKLKARYGQEVVNVQKGRSKRKDFETAQHLLRRDMKFGEFIDACMENKVANDLYLTANNNLLHRPAMRPLLDDMDPFYKGFLWTDPTQTHFWFGAGGTKTPLHFDPISIFHTHISGRKLWNLWAPENAPYLYHREKVYSDVDAYEPDHQKFPLFKHAHRIVETLEVGETLFIPTGWWHTVDSMDTPTVSLSATSWLSAFMRFESRLRSKWPQKSAHPVSGPKGPALPGEQTPKDFEVHDWFVAMAISHQRKEQLPALALDWSQLRAAKDGEEARKVIDRYSTDSADRSDVVAWFLLNPQCSKIQFDWQAWMIENLGLKNSAASLLQVMSRDGDDTTQRTIADTLKECLALGAELWDTPMVEAQAVPQQHIMQRIRDGQAKIHGSAAGAGDAAKWEKIRHVNGWRPPTEFQIQKSFKYPGAEPLSMTPRTVVLRDFLQHELCDELIQSAEPNLVRSTVIGAENDAGRVVNDRTSMGAWLPSTARATAVLEKKVSKLTTLDVDREEGVHVLRYHEGEAYKRHLDGCDATSPDGPIAPECERFLHRSGDRIASVIIMLHEPDKGGNTAFPRVKVLPDGQHEFKDRYAGDCADPSTLQTSLRKGDAILFWGYHPEEDKPEGVIDWASEHTGCTVEKGTKWIATVWLRGSVWRQPPRYPDGTDQMV